MAALARLGLGKPNEAMSVSRSKRGGDAPPPPWLPQPGSAKVSQLKPCRLAEASGGGAPHPPLLPHLCVFKAASANRREPFSTISPCFVLHTLPFLLISTPGWLAGF